MTLIGEPNCLSDVDERHLSVNDQCFRLLDPSAFHVSGRRKAKMVLEHAAEVKTAQSCCAGQLPKGDCSIRVILDVGDCPTDSSNFDRHRLSFLDTDRFRIAS